MPDPDACAECGSLLAYSHRDGCSVSYPRLIKLNLGCGPHIADGYVNVDIVPLPGVDLVADLDEPWPWPDGSVAEILASHLFEHVDKPLLFMAEAWRVLADDGILDIRVPYYRHIFAFTDPTHKRFCTE